MPGFRLLVSAMYRPLVKSYLYLFHEEVFQIASILGEKSLFFALFMVIWLYLHINVRSIDETSVYHIVN